MGVSCSNRQALTSRTLICARAKHQRVSGCTLWDGLESYGAMELWRAGRTCDSTCCLTCEREAGRGVSVRVGRARRAGVQTASLVPLAGSSRCEGHRQGAGRELWGRECGVCSARAFEWPSCALEPRGDLDLRRQGWVSVGREGVPTNAVRGAARKRASPSGLQIEEHDAVRARFKKQRDAHARSKERKQLTSSRSRPLPQTKGVVSKDEERGWGGGRVWGSNGLSALCSFSAFSEISSSKRQGRGVSMRQAQVGWASLSRAQRNVPRTRAGGLRKQGTHS